MNFIIIDKELIVTNIIGKKFNNIGKYLFFIEEDDHLEPILQKGFLDRNSNIKTVAQNLLRILIVLYEKNKKIKLKFNDKKDDMNLTIPENDDIKINLFIDTKPELKYRIIDSVGFNLLYDEGKEIEFDELNDYLMRIKSSCTKIIFEKYKVENEEQLDTNEEEELLRIENSYAPNKVCIKRSKIVSIKKDKFIILRYFVNYNSVKNHVRNVNGNIDKNNIFINMDNEIFLVEKLNKSNYYLISKKLIEIYADVFSL